MQQSTGYFQRLSQRTGLAREQTGQTDTGAASAAVTEINAIREIEQSQSTPHLQTEVPQSIVIHETLDANGNVAPVDERITPAQPTDEPLFAPAPPITEKSSVAPSDAPEPMAVPEPVAEFQTQSTVVEKAALLDVEVSISEPTQVPEFEKLAPDFRELSTPAANAPSFIRQLIEQHVPAFVLHERELEAAPAPLTREAPERDRDASIHRSVMQLELQADESPVVVQHHREAVTQVSIGQISIEVHTPAEATASQTIARPNAAQPAPRPRQVERPTNLHRYYLRGG